MNSLATTMIKKGNYKINVYTASINTTFFVVDSKEGFWTAFNTLGVSALRAKTKSDIADIFRTASIEDLELYTNKQYS